MWWKPFNPLAPLSAGRSCKRCGWGNGLSTQHNVDQQIQQRVPLEWITAAIGDKVTNAVNSNVSKKHFVKVNETKHTWVSVNIHILAKRVFRFSHFVSKRSPIPIDIVKLCICIFIDVTGSSSELLPIVGEATDVIWAPIAALLMQNLFYGSPCAWICGWNLAVHRYSPAGNTLQGPGYLFWIVGNCSILGDRQQ